MSRFNYKKDFLNENTGEVLDPIKFRNWLVSEVSGKNLAVSFKDYTRGTKALSGTLHMENCLGIEKSYGCRLSNEVHEDFFVGANTHIDIPMDNSTEITYMKRLDMSVVTIHHGKDGNRRKSGCIYSISWAEEY